MFKTFDADREYLENKFHDTSKPFDPFNRMGYHGYEYDKNTGLDDDEIKSGLKELVKSLAGKSHPVIKAKAVSFVLDNTRIDVNEHDYFIGINSINRLIDESTVNVWNDEVFSKKIPEATEYMSFHNKIGMLDMWPDFDHSIPDWDALFSLGFKGIIERSEKYRKIHKESGTLTEDAEALFDAIKIEYEAIIRFIDRLYNYALLKGHAKSEKIAACLAHLRDGVPTNTYEILQMIYIYFMISESVDHYQVRSLGHGIDAAIYPYYKHDLESGAYTEDELREYIAYFLMQFSSIGNYWGQPMYLGGTDSDGNTLVNEATYAIIEVYDVINIYNPKVQVKLNYNTPLKFRNMILDMIRKGRSSFVFVCEPGSYEALKAYGANDEEVRTFDISGCYEVHVRGNEVSTSVAYLNVLKVLSVVFHGGFDPVSGKKVFDLKKDSFSDFSEFYEEFHTQLELLIEKTTKVADKFEAYLEYINPAIMYDATVEGALKKGVGAYLDGVKYPNSSILICAFASAVDALMAIKHFVYDTKQLSSDEFKSILKNNWEGYDALRIKALQLPCKYGNNHSETDRYAKEISDLLTDKINSRKNVRGGVYKSIMHTALHYIRMGKKIEATPDGRKSGDETSKNGSPVMGMDKNSVTALISSVIKLVPSKYTEDFCIDVMMHPSAAAGDDGLAAMNALLDVYMKNHGMAIQFNILNADILRDAQKRPEKYKNLQVRVCGWNVLWSNLCKEEQNAYILRAESII